VDRDRRRIGAMAGLWTEVSPQHRTPGCRELLSSSGESLVAMMETADRRERYDLAHGGRLDGSRFRRVLPQGQVRSRTVIVGEVGVQAPAQVPLAEHNDVIEALSPYRSHKPFGVGDRGTVSTCSMTMPSTRPWNFSQ